jgi:hypothetical protein
VLLTNRIRDGVFAGEFDVAFRRWRKPTVKAGGHLRTALGEILIVNVQVIDPVEISDADALRAGYKRADDVRHDLFRERPVSLTSAAGGRSRTAKPNEDSLVYRIEMGPGGEDPRVALRSATNLDAAELAGVLAKLARMDNPKSTIARTAKTAQRDWTRPTLELIETWPARRAPELAEMVGLETSAFKASVRKLKELGLTESLAVGYRLSPRGEVVLNAQRSL